MNRDERTALRAAVGRIFHIETFGTVDGPGVRVVFFLQGCPFRCLYCHNPESFDISGGEIRTAGDIVDEAMKYKSFIKNGGVTFSGGEPLLQPEFLLALTSLLHEQGVHVCIDTAGSVSLRMSAPVIDASDLILLDIKAFSPELFRTITSASNTNTLATLDYCEKIGKPVWIRHVLLPGYTLDKQELESLAGFLSGYTCIRATELIPFHKLGEIKWEHIPERYLLLDTPIPTPDEVAEAQAIFDHAFRTDALTL